VKIIIAGAGVAAHLAGVMAAGTILPVIGVPIAGGAINGIDALYSTVQMPGGIPVATVAIGRAGAKNAGILAVQMLSLSDASLVRKLKEFRESMAREVEAKDRELQEKLSHL
jgi:5-(carboxyamino)imidazole ribonucleotide mutase